MVFLHESRGSIEAGLLGDIKITQDLRYAYLYIEGSTRPPIILRLGLVLEEHDGVFSHIIREDCSFEFRPAIAESSPQ